MPTREIKTKLTLEGEQQYKRAMTDAANAIKVLNSEEKLAAAQFEATGNAEQYAADKTRILKEKIEEQKKAVAAAEEAIKNLTQNGVGKNDKAMTTWRLKLNNAKTALTRMQTAVDGTETELAEQSTALNTATTDAAEYDAQLSAIGKQVDFSAAISAVDEMRARLETVIRTAARVGKAIWEAEVGGGQWADEIATRSQVAGLDVETYQAWTYASRFIDTSVDDIVASRKKLAANLDEPTEDILHDLNSLSVAHLDPVTHRARETTDVFWDVIDALGEVESQSDREKLAMSLLGRSYDNLNPLITAGSKAYKELAEEGRNVAVVSAENIEALGGFDDANQRVDAALQKTKMTLEGELAPAFTRISDSIANALNAFNAFLETDEGQAAIANLNAALGGIATTVESVDFKQALEDVTGLINGFTGGLAWIGEHQEVVVGALGAIAAAWAGLTVAKDVLTFLQLIQSVKNLTGLTGAASEISKAATMAEGAAGAAKGIFDNAANAGNAFGQNVVNAGDAFGKGVGGAGDAFGKGVAGAGGSFAADAGNAGDTFASKLQGVFGKLPDELPAAPAVSPLSSLTGITSVTIGEAALTAGLITAAIASAVVVDKVATKKNWGEYVQTENRADEILAPTEDAAITRMQALWQEMHSAMESYEEGEGIAAIQQTFREHANELLEAMPDLSLWSELSSKGLDLSDGFDANEIERALDPWEMDILAGSWEDFGKEVVVGLGSGIADNQAEAANAAADMAQGVADATAATLDINSPSGITYADGVNVAVGLANGIYDAAPQAIAAAEYLAQSVANIMRSALDIHSPSRVAQEMGGMFGEGFAIGIEDTISRVEGAVSRVVSATSRSPINDGPGGRGAGGQQMIHVSLVLDGRTTAEAILPYVDEGIAELTVQRR